MRRHTLDTDSIRRHLKSVFISPTRKFFNLTNHNGLLNLTHRTRRYSVPEKQHLDKSNNNAELRTINEVSELIRIRLYACSCLLCCSVLHDVNTASAVNLWKKLSSI